MKLGPRSTIYESYGKMLVASFLISKLIAQSKELYAIRDTREFLFDRRCLRSFRVGCQKKYKKFFIEQHDKIKIISNDIQTQLNN